MQQCSSIGKQIAWSLNFTRISRKWSYFILAGPSTTTTTSVRTIRDPSPSLRQSVLTKSESSSSLTPKSKPESKTSAKPVARSGSITRTGVAEAGPAAASVRRTGSKREESPGVSRRTRLGLRNTSPNTSNVSLKTAAAAAMPRLGRSDSARNNKSNPASRSSSFSRGDTRPSVARSGLATLPREAGHRSRSQGDYVTVLEIGGAAAAAAETRSKSASTRPQRDTSLGPGKPVSRSSSLRKGVSTTDGGTVSVHIRHGQDVPGSHLLDPRPAPARKQSIKIGREDPAAAPTAREPRAAKRYLHSIILRRVASGLIIITF